MLLAPACESVHPLCNSSRDIARSIENSCTKINAINTRVGKYCFSELEKGIVAALRMPRTIGSATIVGATGAVGAELLAVLETLPAYCKAHGARLVVVDSVAFHFRQDFRDMALRTAILAKMTNRLMALATDQSLAVVTVNQVTVKPAAETGGGGARLVPALGESYAHACATRVILSWEDDTRVAYLYKSPRLPQGRARYTVTQGGVRDVRGTKRPNEATG